MTGCDQRCTTDSDESGPNKSTGDSAEDVSVTESGEGTQNGGCRSLIEDKVLNQRDGHPFQTKYTRPSYHSWPGVIRKGRVHEIERRNTHQKSPSGENVDQTGIVICQGTIESYPLEGEESLEASFRQQHLQRCCVSVKQTPSATCKLPGTILVETCQVQQEEHQDQDTEPETTTDVVCQTDSDPSHLQHETLQEYRAYVNEVRRAGRQNFAKQTADLLRRTLQVGNWTDISRQVPLTEAQASQVLSETTDTAKEEAMAIYDRHIQDKGSPQRLYKLQEALVKRAVLSLGKRCKGMSKCT